MKTTRCNAGYTHAAQEPPNFRVGNTEHVRVCAGHIGFEILEAFRGQGYQQIVQAITKAAM
jgi:hypothetical protein